MSLATSDTVLALDRFQNTDNRRTCQADPRHGTLIAHASGAHFVCGRKGCDYGEPVSHEIITEATALR